MPNFNTTIHCIGARRNGIVIVTFNPFRVLTINWDSIEEYASTIDTEPDAEATYTSLCVALTAMVLDLSDEDSFARMDNVDAEATMNAMRSMGVGLNNSDLCLTGVIDAQAHDDMMTGAVTARRKGYSMIYEVIDMIINEPPTTPYNITPKIDENYPAD